MEEPQRVAERLDVHAAPVGAASEHPVKGHVGEPEPERWKDREKPRARSFLRPDELIGHEVRESPERSFSAKESDPEPDERKPSPGREGPLSKAEVRVETEKGRRRRHEHVAASDPPDGLAVARVEQEKKQGQGRGGGRKSPEERGAYGQSEAGPPEQGVDVVAERRPAEQGMVERKERAQERPEQMNPELGEGPPRPRTLRDERVGLLCIAGREVVEAKRRGMERAFVLETDEKDPVVRVEAERERCERQHGRKDEPRPRRSCECPS